MNLVKLLFDFQSGHKIITMFLCCLTSCTVGGWCNCAWTNKDAQHQNQDNQIHSFLCELSVSLGDFLGNFRRYFGMDFHGSVGHLIYYSEIVHQIC